MSRNGKNKGKGKPTVEMPLESVDRPKDVCEPKEIDPERLKRKEVLDLLCEYCRRYRKSGTLVYHGIQAFDALESRTRERFADKLEALGLTCMALAGNPARLRFLTTPCPPPSSHSALLSFEDRAYGDHELYGIVRTELRHDWPELKAAAKPFLHLQSPFVVLDELLSGELLADPEVLCPCIKMVVLSCYGNAACSVPVSISFISPLFFPRSGRHRSRRRDSRGIRRRMEHRVAEPWR